KSLAPPPPGTTQALSPALPEAPAPQAGAAPERDEGTAYDVLQRFNRSALERAERKQKVEEESLPRRSFEIASPSPATPRASLEKSGALGSVTSEAKEPEALRDLAPEARPEPAAEALKMRAARAPKDRAGAPSQTSASQAPAPPAPARKVRVAVDP